MQKILSLFLSCLLTIYAGFIHSSHALQKALDQSGFSYCAIGRSIAGWIRQIEAGQNQIPAPSDYKKKVLLDDTDDTFAPNPESVTETETWIVNEVSFKSTKTYADPFNDVDVNLILVGHGVKYIVPGFWDGNDTWRIRFVCPYAGEWLYKTECTDTENAVLHDRTGKVICKDYSGSLDIYKHGFVTTAAQKKYMTYDDGTPFFYLGDTHWSLGDETQEMVQTICQKRVSQGFTVFQSEPIGATFCLENGVSTEDIPGLRDYDAKFQTIAKAGLVHANAEFFFPSYMQVLIANMGGYSAQTITQNLGKESVTVHDLCDNAKRYLEKLSRYWVARYGAYPVLWTLGQEVDNDFYWTAEEHPDWNYVNNPYKLVAEYIDKYDAYSHPITAHMENAGGTTPYGSGQGLDEKSKVYKNSSPSAFRGVQAHSWYGAQWSPSLTKQSDQKTEKDFWYNSQGKPVINYEGRYCYLWTKNFGARMQGWASYLSGMYGYGWGAHDTWSYLNTYNEDVDSEDGVDIITSHEKIHTTWEDALTFASGDQVGYMKSFFQDMEWWNLIPRFNNPLYFARSAGVLAYAASNVDNSEMVIYFYSFSDPSVAKFPNANALTAGKTGRIGSLEPSTVYHYKWFNPITGEYEDEGTFTSTPFGTYSIGQKARQDMVFYLYK